MDDIILPNGSSLLEAACNLYGCSFCIKDIKSVTRLKCGKLPSNIAHLAECNADCKATYEFLCNNTCGPYTYYDIASMEKPWLCFCADCCLDCLAIVLQYYSIDLTIENEEKFSSIYPAVSEIKSTDEQIITIPGNVSVRSNRYIIEIPNGYHICNNEENRDVWLASIQ